MAFARKCDRCNALYEPIPVKVQYEDVKTLTISIGVGSLWIYALNAYRN